MPFKPNCVGTRHFALGLVRLCSVYSIGISNGRLYGHLPFQFRIKPNRYKILFRFIARICVWNETSVHSVIGIVLFSDVCCNRLLSNGYILFPMMRCSEFSKYFATMSSHYNSCHSLPFLYLLSVWQCYHTVCWLFKHCFQVAKITIF